VPDLSDDQRTDDGQSLCFDTPPLTERVEILGEPVLELEVSSDRPQAFLAARLCDVAEDGASLRVTYGLLNLAHRDGHERPEPLVPGRRTRVRLALAGTAYAFPPGHRIRIALSTAYWPIAWPSPEAATVTLHAGAGALLLPVRPPDPQGDASLPAFAEPEGAAPAALVETRPRLTDRSMDRIEEDLAEGRMTLIRTRDRGAWKTVDTDVEYDTKGVMRCSVRADDPLSAMQELALSMAIGRPGWRVRTETEARLTSTADSFVLTGRVEAFEDDRRIFTRAWDLKVKRDNV
jgi:hypothetical protein